MEITQSEQQTERKVKKNESNIWGLWDNTKCANLHVTGVPEGEERGKGIQSVFEEIMAENFPNLKKKTDIQVQEAQRVPNKMQLNRPTPRHIIIKMGKVKERILKAARERFSCKGTPVKTISLFLCRNFAGQRECHDIIKVLKGKNLQPKILCTWQHYHLEYKEREKISQINKN